MAEVTIKAHVRKSKGGKTVQVKSYTRRVGRKGIHSPKRDKTEKAAKGEEFENKMEEKQEEQQPRMTPEEYAEKLKQRKEWEKNYKLAEEERKRLGMKKEQYMYYKVRQAKERERNRKSPRKTKTPPPVKEPLSEEGSMTIMQRVEDKIASFVEKYSGRKYKRML